MSLQYEKRPPFCFCLCDYVYNDFLASKIAILDVTRHRGGSERSRLQLKSPSAKFCHPDPHVDLSLQSSMSPICLLLISSLCLSLPLSPGLPVGLYLRCSEGVGVHRLSEEGSGLFGVG